MDSSTVIVIGALALVIVMILGSAVRVVYQYEAGVVFRLGRLVETRQPGLRWIIPVVDRMRKVDLRIVPMDVEQQEVITQDNVTLSVDAVVYLRVVHPEEAVVQVTDHLSATSLIAKTTLRSVLGQSDMDALLSRREEINQRLQSIIDEQTDPWGVKVSAVEVKNVELPDTLKRAMARQAEAERERRAKVIHAEGEYQAAERLSQAGSIMAAQPATLQLRYLQTITEISAEKSSTVLFPVPIDLVSAFIRGVSSTVEAAPPSDQQQQA